MYFYTFGLRLTGYSSDSAYSSASQPSSVIDAAQQIFQIQQTNTTVDTLLGMSASCLSDWAMQLNSFFLLFLHKHSSAELHHPFLLSNNEKTGFFFFCRTVASRKHANASHKSLSQGKLIGLRCVLTQHINTEGTAEEVKLGSCLPSFTVSPSTV